MRGDAGHPKEKKLIQNAAIIKRMRNEEQVAQHELRTLKWLGKQSKNFQNTICVKPRKRTKVYDEIEIISMKGTNFEARSQERPCQSSKLGQRARPGPFERRPRASSVFARQKQHSHAADRAGAMISKHKSKLAYQKAKGNRSSLQPGEYGARAKPIIGGVLG